MAGGRSPRRSNLIVRDIGGDKPGGMPVTGRTHIFFAQPMHVYRGVSPEGILFCWGWIFRYYIWDFISSFFFARQPVRVFWGWSPVGALILLENFRSLPNVFSLSPIWTGCAPCHSAVPLCSLIGNIDPLQWRSSAAGMDASTSRMDLERASGADAPLLERRIVTKETDDDEPWLEEVTFLSAWGWIFEYRVQLANHRRTRGTIAECHGMLAT